MARFHLGLLFASLLLISACTAQPEVLRLAGKTMGTTYQVSYVAVDHAVEQGSIDKLLAEINQSMSTYIPDSLLSRINTSVDLAVWHPVDSHFEKVWRRSRDVFEDTMGLFNPAVGPLVNAWGFGPEEPESLPTDDEIRKLLALVSFDAFEFRNTPPAVRKSINGARLDFNAIAKGYGVDAVGELLEGQGIHNYLIEIGGEVRARGFRETNRPWQVGIERPTKSAGERAPLQIVVPLGDASMATSGNYRNYQTDDSGRHFSHIMNPRTGYPEHSSLLSVSVIAADCMTADAYATALMVMGMDEGMRFVKAHPGLEAYFVGDDGAGGLVEQRSPGFPVGK